MRPASPDLGRRWLAALLVVPVAERHALVEAVERRIIETYGPSTEQELTIISPPVQREGYVEQIEKTYAVKKNSPAKKRGQERAS